MPEPNERLKSALAFGATRALGRKNLVRLSRFLLDRARLDMPNDMQTNGEVRLQHELLTRSPSASLVVFDVGANQGEWSLFMAKQMREAGKVGRIVAFEPTSTTSGMIRSAVEASPYSDMIAVERLALSNSNGEAEFFVVGEGAGTNSLVESKNTNAALAQRKETVPTRRLDTYCEERGIAHIDFVKVDTEGFDLSVLTGAEALLSGQRIDLVQFEYNWRWIFNRTYLYDAFELAGRFGYHLGKITPDGVEFYDAWHPELETWKEANYLLCTAQWFSVLPKVPWWNA